MVSQRERARLIETWRREPLYVAGALIKCAACLLILFGLAFIGAVTEPSTDQAVLRALPHQGPIQHTKGLARVEISADHAGLATAKRPIAFDVSCRDVC